MDTVLELMFVIVAKIESNRPLVDDGAVAETGSDRIDAALERADLVTGAGVAGNLPIVIADDADHEPIRALKAHRPLPVKIVTAPVIGRDVLEVEGEACRAAHLHLGLLIRRSATHSASRER